MFGDPEGFACFISDGQYCFGSRFFSLAACYRMYGGRATLLNRRFGSVDIDAFSGVFHARIQLMQISCGHAGLAITSTKVRDFLRFIF